ncbi:MAG: hypothetical protein AB7H71_14015 [Alphaproteobacteria bacterium]
MAGLFRASAFVCVENDSKDATKRELRAWQEARSTARLITLDGLDASCPVRTIRLAKARNEYLALIRAEFSDYDFFVIDCDDVNVREIDLSAVARAVDFLGRKTRVANRAERAASRSRFGVRRISDL